MDEVPFSSKTSTADKMIVDFGRLSLICICLAGVALASSNWQYNFDTRPKHRLVPEPLDRADNFTADQLPSHVVGIWQPTSLVTGPDSGLPASSPGTWTLNVDSAPVTDTKYLMLHFTGVNLPGNNRIEVDLGYDTDIFRAADGTAFWTRPINTKRLAGAPLAVRYIIDGSSTGIARIDTIGIGERHAGTQDPTSFSNCDPFLTEATYTEPKYDPTWYCKGVVPQWENVACTDPNDIRVRVAKSAGMIIIPESATPNDPVPVLSTCSVTLIDTDQVILAGHCFDFDNDAIGGSVTFDYETDCAGNRLPGYNPGFYKVKQVLNHRWDSSNPTDGDWARLKLATPVVGVTPIQLRPNLPDVGEAVFGIHHPNAAVKKISLKHGLFATVQTSDPTGITVPTSFHVSGGSSGSCLFDTAGRCVGVLSFGSPCLDPPRLLRYYPSASMLANFAPPVPNPVTKDVMIVFDRSGSMSELDSTGRSKIEVARDTVSLFVQLVRCGVGNRVGLVSFSTKASSPIDLALSALTTTSKQTLIGVSPFAGGKIGLLQPSGQTSIGDGLDKARLQLPPGAPGSNSRAILLLTDGMENASPLIASVAGSLGDIAVHAIGFGSDANLDGAKLSSLASSHAGLYTRASSGVSLQKFFSQAFGNIFETGILMDPELTLLSNVDIAPEQTFQVCKEEGVTVAVGWDNIAGKLGVNLTTPNGIVIGSRSADTEASDGRSWTYLRVPLPYEGNQAGQWNITVFRVDNPSSVIPRFLHRLIRAVSPSPQLQYFVNVIPTGGPTLCKVYDSTTYYTGDMINPYVSFSLPDGSWPSAAKIDLTFSRPNASAGNLLSQTGLGKEVKVAGDTIPARQATLAHLANQISLTDEIIELGNDADSTGNFEETGIYGKYLIDKLLTEGEYQLYYRASTTDDEKCVYTREILWSLHVEIGVDADTTTATTSLTGPGTGTVLVVPRDRYKNPLGPGKSSVIDITGGKGTTVTGPVVDNNDGSYTIPISWTQTNPDDDAGPVIVITQPTRDPVSIAVDLGDGQRTATCPRCEPAPGENKCHGTTSCSVAGPGLGTMCACRPGYKASAGAWRVDWTVAGHEHRVFVEAGRECDVLCDEWWLGGEGCKEVDVRAC